MAGSRGRVSANVSGRLRGREPDWNMATCAEILRSEFPEIDGQVFDYVTGELNRVNGLWRPNWNSGGKMEGGQCWGPPPGLSYA